MMALDNWVYKMAIDWCSWNLNLSYQLLHERKSMIHCSVLRSWQGNAPHMFTKYYKNLTDLLSSSWCPFHFFSILEIEWSSKNIAFGGSLHRKTLRQRFQSKECIWEVNPGSTENKVRKWHRKWREVNKMFGYEHAMTLGNWGSVLVLLKDKRELCCPVR